MEKEPLDIDNHIRPPPLFFFTKNFFFTVPNISTYFSMYDVTLLLMYMGFLFILSYTLVNDP